MPGLFSYIVSKAGLLGFTKTLAREVAPKNVRVLAVAPGFFSTSMTDTLDERFRQESYARTPLQRWGQPEELAWWADLVTHAAARL